MFNTYTNSCLLIANQYIFNSSMAASNTCLCLDITERLEWFQSSLHYCMIGLMFWIAIVKVDLHLQYLLHGILWNTRCLHSVMSELWRSWLTCRFCISIHWIDIHKLTVVIFADNSKTRDCSHVYIIIASLYYCNDVLHWLLTLQTFRSLSVSNCIDSCSIQLATSNYIVY